MKKVVLCMSLVLTTVLLYACQKETITTNQAGQSRVLSSNPDEIFVQDEQTGEWITLTAYNKEYTIPNKAEEQKYGMRSCKVDDGSGNMVNGSVCAKCPFQNCTEDLFICKANS